MVSRRYINILGVRVIFLRHFQHYCRSIVLVYIFQITVLHVIVVIKPVCLLAMFFLLIYMFNNTQHVVIHG